MLAVTVFFDLQLGCCGSLDATDWGIFNYQFIVKNSARLPSSCECSYHTTTGYCHHWTFPIPTVGDEYINQTAWELVKPLMYTHNNLFQYFLTIKQASMFPGVYI